MYKNAIKYTFKNEVVWLAPNSEAYKLFQEKKIKELDKLLETCDTVYRKWLKI